MTLNFGRQTAAAATVKHLAYGNIHICFDGSLSELQQQTGHMLTVYPRL